MVGGFRGTGETGCILAPAAIVGALRLLGVRLLSTRAPAATLRAAARAPGWRVHPARAGEHRIGP